MSSRSACERRHCFNSSVGSSFDDRDKSKGPSGAVNRDRYNSVDGQLRLNAFNRIGV